MPRGLKKFKKNLRKASKFTKILNRKGSLSILLGCLLIFLVLIWQHYRIRILSFEGYPAQAGAEEPVSYSNPVQIKIPKVGLELLVFEGTIKSGVWETTEKGVVHLDKSADPGQGGNIVVYGHNKNLLFGPIRWLSVGDEITLTDTSGNVFKYRIIQVIETTPEDIQYVLPKDEEVLTIYTCTGFLDSKRHIVVAKPIQD